MLTVQRPLPGELKELQVEIERISKGYGLDCYDVLFEMVDWEQLSAIAAQGGFPTRYPHWRFGMEYEQLSKSYTYGLSKIYELVINNDPCYAYLLDSNLYVDQKLVMAHVMGHCLAPETSVETRLGVKPIREVALGEEVLTHRGRYRPVTAVASRPHRGTIYEVAVGGSNQRVRVTAEHPVLAVRGARCVLAGRGNVGCRPTCQTQHKCSGPRPYEQYRPEWIPAGDLRAGDWVAFPRRQLCADLAAPAVEIPFDKVLHRRRRVGRHVVPVDHRLAKFLGYFIAEGNAQDRGLVGFGFHREELDYQHEVAALAAALFDARVGRDESRTALATTVRFNNLEVARWLRSVIGRTADAKRIPDFIMEHADPDVLAACVSGMFNGDGTFAQTPGRQSGTLSLTTTSETLAYQLRHACLRLGVRSSIHVKRRGGSRRTAYDVIWSGESAHRISRLLLGTDVIEGNREFERGWLDDQYSFVPVRSVTPQPYDDLVYNFSVAEDESYTLAAGFAVHNCDFFKKNVWFGHTNRKMMDEMANHSNRIRGLMDRVGETEVEDFIDVCLSVEDLIDIHSPHFRQRAAAVVEDEDAQHRPEPTRFDTKEYLDRFVNPRDRLIAEAEQLRQKEQAKSGKFPNEPERDVLLFLMETAPLKPWQREVLSILREEAYYFAPQGQTKIMNEGWASYWHSTMMCNDLLSDAEVIDFADHHSGTMAMGPGSFNPYKIGIELFRDVEERWNRGMFGKEYDECDDPVAKKRWDKQLGLGRQKIFEVRRTHNDVTFIDSFLTEDFCRRHKLFSFSYVKERKRYEIESREFAQVKERLLFMLTNHGRPFLYVEDANHRNRKELYLKHKYLGAELRHDYARAVLGNLFKLWTRPVHVETVSENRAVLLSFDGKDHSTHKLEKEAVNEY